MTNLGAALLILTRFCYEKKYIQIRLRFFWLCFTVNFNNIECISLIQCIFLFGKPVENGFQSNIMSTKAQTGRTLYQFNTHCFEQLLIQRGKLSFVDAISLLWQHLRPGNSLLKTKDGTEQFLFHFSFFSPLDYGLVLVFLLGRNGLRETVPSWIKRIGRGHIY